MSIFVGNLSYDVEEEDLKEVFLEYGTVKRVQVAIDRETGQKRGFAFVEMGTEAEETAAIDALDGAEWMGRNLKVNKAKPKTEGGSSGGRRGETIEEEEEEDTLDATKLGDELCSGKRSQAFWVIRLSPRFIRGEGDLLYPAKLLL